MAAVADCTTWMLVMGCMVISKIKSAPKNPPGQLAEAKGGTAALPTRRGTTAPMGECYPFPLVTQVTFQKCNIDLGEPSKF